MSAETISAYVLHSRAYGDTSRIVDLYSIECGRISAMFKGVRGVVSKRSNVLEPFTRLSIALRGRSALKNANVLEAQQPFSLNGSKKLYSGLYVNELLVRLLHEGEPNLELFAAYEWLLKKLVAADDVADYLRVFEYRLLASLGVPLVFERDTEDGPMLAEHVYEYIAGRGFVAANAVADNLRYYSGAILLAIAHQQWSPSSRMAAKTINRRALQVLLGDRPLASRELFKAS